jgi:anti-sigma factor RsiW
MQRGDAMKECTTYAPMLSARLGELTPDEESRLQAHLAGCAACQARLADEQAVSGMLAEALQRAAARRDFAAFADGVMARIPESAWKAPAVPGLRGAPAAPPLSGLAALRAFFRRHRVLAAASAVVPALAALGLFLYFERAGLSGATEPGVQVESETMAPVVLDTSDGPVILFGDESEGT